MKIQEYLSKEKESRERIIKSEIIKLQVITILLLVICMVIVAVGVAEIIKSGIGVYAFGVVCTLLMIVSIFCGLIFHPSKNAQERLLCLSNENALRGLKTGVPIDLRDLLADPESVTAVDCNVLGVRGLCVYFGLRSQCQCADGTRIQAGSVLALGIHSLANEGSAVQEFFNQLKDGSSRGSYVFLVGQNAHEELTLRQSASGVISLAINDDNILMVNGRSIEDSLRLEGCSWGHEQTEVRSPSEVV